MSLWTIAEEKRIATLAARNAYWIILERHEQRLRHGDNSLATAMRAASANMWATELEYSAARRAAANSDEPHPEDSHGH